MGSGGKGKRAGVRVIYFHQVKHMRSDYCLFIVRVLKMICLPRKGNAPVVKYEVVNG